MSTEMKESGVAWIDSIPADWKMYRMKDAGTFQTGRDYKHMTEGVVPVYGSSKTPFAYVSDSLCNKPAIAIGRKGTVDAPFFIDGEFWAVDTCMYHTVSDKKFSIRFLSYWMHVIPWATLATQTALPSLTQTDANNAFVALPPLSEQQAIADFLDRETALIDKKIGLIARKKELLAELKKSVVHEAVTKGLNRNAAMKDSGVEWIGEIPLSWKVCRIQDWLYQNKEINEERKEKNILSLTLNGVLRNDPENPIGLVPSDYASYQIFEKDDLVFKLIDLENTRTSRVGLVWERGIMSPAYIRLRPTEKVNVQFAYWVFIDWWNRDVFQNLGGSGVRSSLAPSELLKTNIVSPSLQEQQAVADFLDKEMYRIEKMTIVLNKQEALLKEQRKALIHEVVTGKRRVV